MARRKGARPVRHGRPGVGEAALETVRARSPAPLGNLKGNSPDREMTVVLQPSHGAAIWAVFAGGHANRPAGHMRDDKPPFFATYPARQ